MSSVDENVSFDDDIESPQASSVIGKIFFLTTYFLNFFILRYPSVFDWESYLPSEELENISLSRRLLTSAEAEAEAVAKAAIC